jgi:hypothetical protein
MLDDGLEEELDIDGGEDEVVIIVEHPVLVIVNSNPVEL